MPKNQDKNDEANNDGALIECPLCKTQISSTAQRCYSCGTEVGILVAKSKQDTITTITKTQASDKSEINTLQVINTSEKMQHSNESIVGHDGSKEQIVNSQNTPAKINLSNDAKDQREIDELKLASDREDRDIDILKSELDIKNAELKIFEEQESKLKRLEQVKEMLDHIVIERDRLKDEVSYYKKRNAELDKYAESLHYLESEVDRKEAFIEELLKEKATLQEEVDKNSKISEDLEEKKSKVEFFKDQVASLKERLKQYETVEKRDDQLKGIRQILEKETQRREKLQLDVLQLENARNLLKKEKKERVRLQKELDEKDSELGEMENLNELWEAQKKECLKLRGDLANKAKIDDLLKEEELKRKSIEETIKLRDEKINNLNDEMKKLNEQVNNLKKFKTLVNEERTEKEKVQAELEEKLNYIHNLEQRLIELEKAVPTVKCPSCNKPLRVDAKTCPFCGAIFSEELISIESKHEHDLTINLEELQQKQQQLENREKEILQIRKDFAEKENVFNGKWETLKYKEEELTRRENEIAVLTSGMEEQKSFLNTLKNEMKDPTTLVKLNEELQNLKSELRLKEEAIRDREQHLAIKLRDFEINQGEVASSRIDAYDMPDEKSPKVAPLKHDKIIVKIKTGSPRLDDLMFGGFPAGSNILLSGPSFIGKETLCNLFIAEGLNRNIPCLYITIDENYTKRMARLAEMVPNCIDCEKKDIIRYIDLYTIRTNPSLRSMHHPENVDFIENLRDVEALAMMINEILDTLSKKGKYYRIVFPISTLLMNLDSMTVIKFIEQINARVKMDSSVAIYDVNPGLHAERDVEMVRHIMDGTIEFRVVEDRKSLSIKGISNVQTRAWIEYNNTETGLIIGSFTVEKIK